MPATLINSNIILNEMLMEVKNQMTMIAKISRQYSGQFGSGQNLKRGDVVSVRRRQFWEAVDTFATNGDATGNIRDIVEGSVQIRIDQQPTVIWDVTSQDLTLDINDFRERYIRPAAIEIVQQVESRIAAEYVYAPGFFGTPGTRPSTFTSVAEVDAYFDNGAIPMMDGMRCMFVTPDSMVSLAADLNNVFPNRIAETAIERALIMQYGGLDLYKCQSLPTHTVGNYTGSTPLVNGAGQEIDYSDTKDLPYHQQTLITDGWNASTNDVINQGDVFTIDGVFAVNPRTRQTTGRLQDFTIISSANNSDAGGNLTVTVSPGIITTGAFQTVFVAGGTVPDDAALTIRSGAPNAIHKNNLSWHRDAIELVTCDLEPMKGGVDTSVDNMDGISMRVSMDSDVITDQSFVRVDMLLGTRLTEYRGVARLTE